MFPLVEDGTPAFTEALQRLSARGATDLGRVEASVRQILNDVRTGGDTAVCGFVERFEQRKVERLVLTEYDGARALSRLPEGLRESLELAARRIASYHERQRSLGFSFEEDGVHLAMRVRPLARVGVYAPGGKARYPSSILMSAIPARVAGVKDIVVATPNPDNVTMAAAHLAGVTSILDAGGAHAIGAMAYGTESLPRVDKIVGPGNVYVACAKKLVFGDVGIDGIAGPSEILVVSDDSADSELVAADLLSQAEHDEESYAILLSTSRETASTALVSLTRQLSDLPRRAIAEQSLRRNAVALIVSSSTRLREVANLLGAEHAVLHVRDPEQLAKDIQNVGALLVGSNTPVTAGDYIAGPSHVLPTGGAVRFASPLGVYDFVTRSSVLRYSECALLDQAGHLVTLARTEGLEAHARAVEARLGKEKNAPR